MPVHSFPTPAPVTLRVRNPSGSVAVSAEQIDQSTVDVRPRKADANSEDYAERTRIELSADGTRLDVEAPDHRFGSGTRLDITIRVPVGSVVAAKTASADLRCTGRLGALEAGTASGDVTADQIDGDASVNSASGDITLGEVVGSVQVKTASGDLRVTSIGASCRAHSASGDVMITAAGGDLTARTASGDITVRDAHRGSIDVTTMSGDVAIGVRRETVVWLDLSTMSGRTRSELEHDDDAPAEGGAVLSISARTMSGDIVVSPSTTSAR